jgi:hypothetical protein
MTPEEEKDFTEKVIRLSYKCAEELRISHDKVVSDVFIKWLIDKVDNKKGGKKNGKKVKSADVLV